jgi:hypothetical protein
MAARPYDSSHSGLGRCSLFPKVLSCLADFTRDLIAALETEAVRQALRAAVGRRSPPRVTDAAGGAGDAAAGSRSRGPSDATTPAGSIGNVGNSEASSASTDVTVESALPEGSRAAVLGGGRPAELAGGGPDSIITRGDSEDVDSAARVSGSSGTRTTSGTTATED